MSTVTTASEDVPAGDYKLDPVHSTFGFAVKHNGVSTFRGQFEQVVAKLEDGVLTGIAQVESFNTPLADLKSQLSTGLFGAVWAQAEVRKVLGIIGADVIDLELPVRQADAAFADDGQLGMPEQRAVLNKLVHVLSARADAIQQEQAA